MSAPEWWNKVVQEINKEHQANPANLPGAALAVETPETGPLYGSVGDNVWRNNPICSLASMTKPLTATAVLLALEQSGRFDPDTRVHTIPGMNAWASDSTPRHDEIKVRHLLQHISGLPWFQPLPAGQFPAPCVGKSSNWTGSPGFTNECIQADGQWHPGRHIGLFKSSYYVMRKYDLLFEPGTRWQYSNFGYMVAARIVESLTGQSLNLYIRDHITKPLGMTDTFFIAQSTGNPSLDAAIYEGPKPTNRIPSVVNLTVNQKLPFEFAPSANNTWDNLRTGWSNIWPEGGAYSTTKDLLIFLRLLREGGVLRSRQILSQKVVDYLTKDHAFKQTLGFGYEERGMAGYQSKGTIDHLGRFMTYFWLDPVKKLSGVFLSQRLPGVINQQGIADEGEIEKGTGIIDQFQARVYDWLERNGNSGTTPSLPRTRIAARLAV